MRFNTEIYRGGSIFRNSKERTVSQIHQKLLPKKRRGWRETKQMRSSSWLQQKLLTSRLRTFEHLFLRVGKRSLAGLIAMTMRNDPVQVFFFSFFFPSPDDFFMFFLDFPATSILPDERSLVFFKQDEVWFGLDCYEEQTRQINIAVQLSKTKVPKWCP